jgi:signal transduction histidine kinase
VIATIPWIDRLAHDLRGPLTPLQTASYLLRSGQVSPERQQELFALIERQTRQLVRMIDELGDWTRAAQDRLISAAEPCDPALLLDYARANSGAAGTNAIVDNQADGLLIGGDPVRLTQLLRILLEYGATRTDSPPAVRLRADDKCLTIELRSTGGAPEPDQLAMLLEQPQTDAHDEGLGLQLLIARAIAEAHGGTLVALTDGVDLVLRCELPVGQRGEDKPAA